MTAMRQRRNDAETFVPNGHEIRRRRKLARLTQHDLARKSGYVVRTIQRVEKGLPVKFATLVDVAHVLGIKAERLLALDNHRAQADRTPGDFSLHVCSFEDLILQRTAGFCGRAFLFKALDRFMTTHESGYFVVEGDPGIGKSAWLARLVQKRQCPVHHFNWSTHGINTHRHFLGNICARLISTFNLPYNALPDDFHCDSRFLAKLLWEASERLQGHGQLLIPVDALDEVQDLLPSSSNSLYLPQSLPPNVYVVATVRRLSSIRLRVNTIETLTIEPEAPLNSRDVRDYLHSVCGRRQLTSWLQARRMSTTTFVKGMLAKSRGNFMYLHYVIPEIEDGNYRNLAFTELPLGLEDYYEDHWNRMGMSARPCPKDKVRILFVLCAAASPISANLLADFANEDQITVQAVLDDWIQFLHTGLLDGQTTYGLYHASFLDFLKRRDIVKAAGMGLPEANRLIADAIEKDLMG